MCFSQLRSERAEENEELVGRNVLDEMKLFHEKEIGSLKVRIDLEFKGLKKYILVYHYVLLCERKC